MYVNVPEEYSRGITVGMTAGLTLAEFPDRGFQGEVVRTARTADGEHGIADSGPRRRMGPLKPARAARMLRQVIKQCRFKLNLSRNDCSQVCRQPLAGRGIKSDHVGSDYAPKPLVKSLLLQHQDSSLPICSGNRLGYFRLPEHLVTFPAD